MLCTTLRVEVAAVVPVNGDEPRQPLLVALGGCRRVPITPAQVFRPALSCYAEGIVLVHNHPEGGPPSGQDEAVTRRLVAAGAVLGIPLVAHLVMTEGAWIECVG